MDRDLPAAGRARQGPFVKRARRKPKPFNRTPALYREPIADPDLLLAAVGKPTVNDVQREAAATAPTERERWKAARQERLAEERYARDLARRWPEYAKTQD